MPDIVIAAQMEREDFGDDRADLLDGDGLERSRRQLLLHAEERRLVALDVDVRRAGGDGLAQNFGEHGHGGLLQVSFRYIAEPMHR